MRSLLFSVTAAAFLFSCSEAIVEKGAEELVWDTFGGEVTDGEFVTIADVVADRDANIGKTVRVEGTVESVCKKKGCWMYMDGEEQVRVKFKDYAFFVPLDCEGRRVQLVGDFDANVTSAADLKHLLEDAGKTEEAAKVTEGRTELVLVATGVRMEPVAETADAESGE